MFLLLQLLERFLIIQHLLITLSINIFSIFNLIFLLFIFQNTFQPFQLSLYLFKNYQYFCYKYYLQLQDLMTIRAKAEEQDLEAVFALYFSNQQAAQIAVWVYANDEMNVDGLAKYIGSFKNPKKAEFLARTFDFTHYRLREAEANPDEAREMELSPELRFISKFRDEFVGRLDQLGPPTKHLLNTGIQNEMNALLFQLKSEPVGNGENAYSEPKTKYLEKLIEQIVEKFYKDNEDGVAEKIIAYGGIEPVLNTVLFSSDLAFKNKFKTILYNCKTFSELRKYGGKDIGDEKNKLVESISNCLIKLKFNEKTAQEICDELLKKPLSNIVALRDDLTNKQKQSYYNSQFYRSGELKAFAQINGYENSLQYKVKEDVTKIFAVIEEQARNSKETIDNVLSFNLYGLLKISSIRHIKKNIYQEILRNCPDFLKAFKLVKYQNKNVTSLKENERINQKMALIDVFFKIKLPFEEWEKAETKILDRDYKIIEQLTLKFRSKHELMQHIFTKVEPYFHKIEKQLDYRYEVEHALLQLLMDTQIGDNINMEFILNIINETLDSENYVSESISEYSRLQQRAYSDVLKVCNAFKQFKSNKGRDIKEEQYQKSWQLKEKIYEANLEDKIDVSYESIDNFIEKVIADGGRIPKSHPQYITNLSKLIGEPIEPIVEEIEPEKPISQQSNISQSYADPSSPVKISQVSNAKVDKEELNRNFNSLAEKMFNTYTGAVEDSLLEKGYNEKYGKNVVNLMKRIVETNAFNNQGSPFFTELAFNTLLTKRIKAEFAKNIGLISADLQECASILQKLNQGDAPQQFVPVVSSPAVSPSKKVDTAKLEEEFKTCATAFSKQYMDGNEDSLFEKALNEKYGKDVAKLVRAIIDGGAFDNGDSAFFSGLTFNTLLTKRIKAEFAKNAGLATSGLRRCKEIVSLLK